MQCVDVGGILDVELHTEIPILAMTADAFDNDIEATKSAGMNAHLTKPVVAETLYRVVGQYWKG